MWQQYFHAMSGMSASYLCTHLERHNYQCLLFCGPSEYRSKNRNSFWCCNTGINKESLYDCFSFRTSTETSLYLITSLLEGALHAGSHVQLAFSFLDGEGYANSKFFDF